MIVSTPGTCGGEPRIDGTRITVAHIYTCFFRKLWDVNKILAAYPHLKRDQVMEAIKYARRHPECLNEAEDDG